MIWKFYQDSATIAIDDEHHDDDADDLNEGDERGLEALAEPGVGRQEDVGEVRNDGRVPINLWVKNFPLRPSIKDVRKFFWIFDPLRPSPPTAFWSDLWY